MTVLQEIIQLISFNKCAIFVINPEMSHVCEQITPELDQFFSARLTLEGNVHILGISLEEPVPNPKFKKLEDVHFGLKTLSCLVQPVLDSNDEIVFVIQIEAGANKKANKTQNFEASDEQVLKILCQFLSMFFQMN